jgi:hypothetical protein
MTKAGKRLIAAAKEAIAIAKRDPDVIKDCRVTPSCGCVFCDLGLEPDWIDAQPVHFLRKENRYVECGNPESQPG